MGKSRQIRWIAAVAFVGSFLAAFQNCSKGFQTRTFDQSSEFGQALSTKILNCDIPANPSGLLSQTCLSNGILTNNEVSTINSVATPPDMYRNLRLFVPQYPLYSDGASKRRWIYIPAGKKIDSIDPDNWVFPVGTVVWKEFSVGGKKIETRQIEKVSGGMGTAAWRFSVYAWRSDQSDAELIVNDFYSDADAGLKFAATSVKASYQVLMPNQCVTCHASSKDTVLGFDYLQLSSGVSPFTLEEADRSDFLTHMPNRLDSIKGDSDLERRAIGYIQANCATCHNGVIHPYNFKHVSTVSNRNDENVIKADLTTTSLIVPHSPTTSLIYLRMSSAAMPPRSSVPLKVTDPVGLKLIQDWINSVN